MSARTAPLLLALGLLLVACPKPQPGPTDDGPHDSGPSDGGGKTCKPEDCGPKPGMPNTLCDDGVTMSGPGECVAKGDACGWEIVECPPSAEPVHCGGIAARPCPEGMICLDDPHDDCDPNNGGADCGGICEQDIKCGGIAGFKCPDGTTCIDDPRDDCHPKKGGADCIGVCQRK